MFLRHFALLGLFLTHVAPAIHEQDPEEAHELDSRLEELFRNAKYRSNSMPSSAGQDYSADEDVLLPPQHQPGKEQGIRHPPLPPPLKIPWTNREPTFEPGKEQGTSRLSMPMPVPQRQQGRNILPGLEGTLGTSLPPSIEGLLGSKRSPRKSPQQRPETDRGSSHNNELSFSEYLKRPTPPPEKMKAVHNEETQTPPKATRNHKTQTPSKYTQDEETQTRLRPLRNGMTQTPGRMSLERDRQNKRTQTERKSHREMQTQTEASVV